MPPRLQRSALCLVFASASRLESVSKTPPPTAPGIWALCRLLNDIRRVWTLPGLLYILMGLRVVRRVGRQCTGFVWFAGERKI